MSRTIDERVVSMQFDNSKFESNVRTSLGTLDKLKQSLNFTGAAKGLDSINSAARGMSFSGLSSAVDSVKLKFSALEVMAVTALSNITNSAVNAGKKLVSAFTIEPIKTGFQEYETQIGAVQTILANTQHAGTDLDDVNAALDELNQYADQTIYNFTEMTRNIGTFTAAGVDLDKSVQSIKGIANLAAVSGSNSQQASTAMYQLSQALAAGKVSLMDWNSVVNAGMGGKLFQDALLRTSELLKTGGKEAVAAYGSFRESLTKGEWLTTEVLTETLAQLSGAYTEADLIAQGYTEEQAREITELAKTASEAATKVKTFTQLIDTLKESAQSGWTQTWELLVGDFEQAKEMWSQASETLGGFINESAKSRNDLLAGALESNWDKLNSKIESTGIQAGKFEETLKSVAKEHGVDVEALVAEYGSLEKAIKEGKISSDIFKDTLDKLGESMGGLEGIRENLKFDSVGEDVKKVQKILQGLGYDLGKKGADGIIGQYTEDAIKAFQKAQGLKVTGIVDQETIVALEKASSEVNKLSESCGGLIAEIDKLGGRELLIQSVKNIFNGLLNVIKPIKRAFNGEDGIFPKMTSEQLYKIIEGVEKLTSKFAKWTSANGEKIYNTFKGIFSIFDIGWTFVKDLAGGLVKLLGHFTGLSGGILDITSSFGTWLTGLRDSVKETDIFGTAIDKIVEFLGKAIDKIKEFGSFLKGKLVMPGWEGFLSVMSAIWDVIKKIGSKIADVGSSIGEALSSAFSSGDISAGLDIINGGLFAGLLLSVKKFFKGLTDSAGEGFGLFESIKETLGSVRESLETWQQTLKAGILRNIAISIGILAASLLVLSLIDQEKLAGALAAITVLFFDLMKSLSAFTKMNIVGLNGVGKAVGAMIGISAAVLIMAFALKKIADLGWEELAKGLVGIVALTGVVVGAAKLMSMGEGDVKKGAVQMVIFAVAVKILASACRDLSSLGWEELAKGLVGVGVLMAAVSIFVNSTKSAKGMAGTAVGVVILAAGLKILANVCKDFGAMNWNEIVKGLVSIGLLLAEIAIFTRLTGDAKKVISTGLALVFIASSMKIFASAVSDFAGMSWEQLGKGLLGLAGALTAVTLAMRFMPKNVLSVGAGLLIVSAALIVLAEALGQMGGMGWGEIAKSLVALGGSMLILAVGLNIMNGTLAGSAALIVAAGALAILTPVLKTLGSMSVGSIVKGLLAMAGAFAVIGLAGLLLSPLVPTILALGAAFALIGFSVLAVGIGLAAVAAGLTALATAGTAGATAIVAALTIIVTGIANLIPVLATKFGEAIVVFCQVIGDSATAIGEAVVKVLFAIMDTIEQSLPRIIDFVFNVLIAIMDGLAARLPELIQSAVDLLTALFTGIADAIMSISPADLAKSALGIGIMAALMGVFSLIAPLVPGALTGVLGMAAVVAEIGVLLAAFGALAQIPGLMWLIGEGGEMLKQIGGAIGGFIGSIVGGIAEGFTASLPQIGTDLSTFMTNLTPFIDGAKQIDESMFDGVKTLVGIITALTGASILDGIASWFTGGSSLTKFAEEIVPFGVAIKEFANEVTGLDEAAVSAAANAGMALTAMADTIPNTGGLVAFFAGENDMATFGTQLVSFGSALKSFATEVTGLDTEALTNVATAGQSLVTLANTIPNTGGLVAFFAGDNDMATFGSQLISFGAAIKGFALEVTGLDTAAIATAAAAGTSLVSLANTIPNTGGLVAFFAGDNDMATFGTQIKAFGTGIKGFATEVAGLDTEAVNTAVSAGMTLSNMANALPESGGLWSVFAADNDMSTFASEIKKFGEGISNFSESVSGIDNGSVSAAATAGLKLAQMANDLPDGKTLDRLGTLGDKLKSFGKKLKDFASEMSDTDASKFTDIANGLNKLAKIKIDNADTIQSFVNSLGKVSADGVNKFASAFKDSAPKVIASVNAMLTLTANAVRNKGPILKNAFQDIAKACPPAMKSADIYSQLQAAGKYLVQGFANGISVNTYLATAQAIAMANAAKEAAKKALKINSPSKIFQEIGKGIPEGLANGIVMLGSRIKSSVSVMSNTAMTSTKKVISRIVDVLNSDMDVRPVITPVLDLSEVYAGVSKMNSMLSIRPSAPTLSSVDAITSSINTGSAVADSVTSAIKDLKNTISSTKSGDTYNVNGITYDDGSNVASAVKSLVKAARLERRV